MAPSRPGSGRTALLLLSAPGSGADALRRALEACGAAPPVDGAAVAALNDRALAAMGSGRDEPFGPRRRGGAPSPPAPLSDEVRALLRTAEPHAPLLLLSDPGVTPLAGFWTAALEAEGWRVAAVVLVRAPGEAAAALSAEAGATRNRGLLLWASRMLEAERATRGGRRVVVALDRLLADPEVEFDRIERALALRLPRRTWDSAAEVEAALRDAHRPAAAAPSLPEALAPLGAFADHLLAAAADEPGNADVPAETERWFTALAELAAPTSRRPDAPEAAGPAQPAPSDAQLEAARREAAEAAGRADAAEAQVTILQGALAVSRRRASEAETLLQARATEASAGEREARAALATAVAGREAAAEALSQAHERLAELDGRLAEADARAEVLTDTLRQADGALRRTSAELDDERGRHAGARERLALTGVANHAAQTRVRELERRLAAEEAERERRRRWLPRLFGLR